MLNPKIIGTKTYIQLNMKQLIPIKNQKRTPKYLGIIRYILQKTLQPAPIMMYPVLAPHQPLLGPKRCLLRTLTPPEKLAPNKYHTTKGKTVFLIKMMPKRGSIDEIRAHLTVELTHLQIWAPLQCDAFCRNEMSLIEKDNVFVLAFVPERPPPLDSFWN